MQFRLLLGIGASVLLLACGGGGGDETVVASDAGASTSTPSASSPAPVTPAGSVPQGAMPGSGGTGFASAPSPPVLEPIVQSAERTGEAGVPVASGPISSACPQTPDEARNAATRNEFGQIIGVPACMTRPDPMAASEQEIETWNAICQTARCLVVAGRLP